MDKLKDNNIELEKTEISNISSKNIDTISYFNNDSNFVFVYKKTEKLATAVYLVTNFLSDNEPIKWTFRKKVSELLEFILGFKDIFISQTADFTSTTKNKILEMVSFLEILSGASLISPMNASVLKQEFGNLLLNIETSPVSRKEPSRDLLPKDFFVVHESNQDQKHEYMPEYGSINQKNPIRHKTQGALDGHYRADGRLVKRSNRQNTILGLLRKKGGLTIKNMSEVIKDCSEKTIQRELISFISGGVVKREGERRWSRYSLAL